VKKTTTFGQTLRRRRRLLDITQEALAGISGVSETHIKRLEKDLPEPGMNVIFQLSYALQMEPGELLQNAYEAWKEKRKEEEK